MKLFSIRKKERWAVPLILRKGISSNFYSLDLAGNKISYLNTSPYFSYCHRFHQI